MTGMMVSVVFYLGILALSCWKPNAGRICVGVFFLLMAYGVNGVIAATNPSLFVPLGSGSLLPAYRTLFLEVVAAQPRLWGLVAVAYETAVGLLILSRGRPVQVGLAMAMVFLVGITPFSAETLANPILALVCMYLLTREFPESLPGMLRLRLTHR